MLPDNYIDLVERPVFAHVATVGPNGEPHNTPVWFDWDGTHIRFSQTTERQKYRNVGREPRVALSMIDPDNPYRYLEIRGVVDAIDPDPDLAFINSMAKRYMDVDEYPFHQPNDVRVVVKVRPEHTTQMG